MGRHGNGKFRIDQCNAGIDQIVENNEVVEEEEEILIDQMSIYEFLDE